MTTTAEIERALISALGTIADHWAALMAPSGSGGVASKPVPRSLYTRADDDERDDDLPNIDRRIALRDEVTTHLMGWAKVIVEDRNIKPWKRCDHGVTVTLRRPFVGPTRVRCASRIEWAKDDDGVPQSGIHAVQGDDTLGLCALIERHAQWFSGHEAAPDAVDELRGWAGRVKAAAAPQRRDWMPIGTCPLETEPGGDACGGQVRAYPGHDPRCQKCGTEADVAWWERVMFPDVETSELMIEAEVATFVHRAFGGSPINPSTVRQWVSRGVIESSGKDEKGRSLYSREAVIWAMTQREARAIGQPAP